MGFSWKSNTATTFEEIKFLVISEIETNLKSVTSSLTSCVSHNLNYSQLASDNPNNTVKSGNDSHDNDCGNRTDDSH